MKEPAGEPAEGFWESLALFLSQFLSLIPLLLRWIVEVAILVAVVWAWIQDGWGVAMMVFLILLAVRRIVFALLGWA